MADHDGPGSGTSDTADGAAARSPGLSEDLRRKVADLVLETTAEGIWLIDAEARTTFVNRRLAELLGYREDEMLGRYVFEFLDRDRWPNAQRNLRLREAGVEDRQEVELVRKDGTRVWVLGSANPILDRDGNYLGALALLGDLSEQKDREHLLRAQVSDLRERLAAQIGRCARQRRAPSPREAPPVYREPFRTAIVLGVMGTLLATVAVTAAGAVVGAWLGADRPDGSGA
jgi:PAS domain S-box-containing protein